MRTTSSLESMNAALRRISRPHPNFFKFIDCIRMHEFSKSMDLLEIIKYGVRVQKGWKVEKLDSKIRLLTLALERDPDMNPGLFLDEFIDCYALPETGMILFEISAPIIPIMHISGDSYFQLCSHVSLKLFHFLIANISSYHGLHDQEQSRTENCVNSTTEARKRLRSHGSVSEQPSSKRARTSGKLTNCPLKTIEFILRIRN